MDKIEKLKTRSEVLRIKKKQLDDLKAVFESRQKEYWDEYRQYLIDIVEQIKEYGGP